MQGAWQLTGRAGRGGPAAGTVYQEVRLTNQSSRPCTLSGGPSAVTGVRADGSMTTLTPVAYGGRPHLAALPGTTAAPGLTLVPAGGPGAGGGRGWPSGARRDLPTLWGGVFVFAR